MNILENNRTLIANLVEQFQITGLRIEGEYLVCEGESCNISKFNIYDLLDGNSNFRANIDSLTAKEIFDIVRLHTLSMKSNVKQEDKLAEIKKENPLLKNVTIVPRNKDTGREEIINIVDSTGKDETFINVYHIDFFEVYEDVKAKVGSDKVTPEDLIREMQRRINELRLESSKQAISRGNADGEYEAGIKRVSEPYNSSNSVNVLGNEDANIAIVSDTRSKDDHNVITFEENKFGDTVMEGHKQDIKDRNTSTVANDTGVVATSEEKRNDIVVEDTEAFQLMSTTEFYTLVDSSEQLTEKQKEDMGTYYKFLGDLMKYEQYLLPDLMNVLNTFRAHVLDWYARLNSDQSTLTINQKDALKISVRLEQEAAQVKDKVVNTELDFNSTSKTAEARTLRLERKYKDANQGFASTVLIMMVIIVVTIILTVVTLCLV